MRASSPAITKFIERMLRTRPFQASIETALNYKKLILLGQFGRR
jgi:hypothetical protein